MKKHLIRIITIIAALYIIFCGFFYFFQQEFIFHPQKLNTTYTFHFKQNFEEINIKTTDGILLNSLLFKANDSKGLILYLHGNAGALDSWGRIAPVYTDLGYDILFVDYRGFGKSGGEIDNEEQLHSDMQCVYNEMKKSYEEDKIIVLGYSIGTGLAAKVASENSPQMLILQAPYYSLTNVIKSICPIIPDFTIRYKLETYKFILKCKMPIVIFHGDKDNVIDYSNSLKLKPLLKDTDRLITLSGEGHNNITENQEYRRVLTGLLNDSK
ncbi:alpha/beta hydrolase [Prevotella sp. 10(H)]|uniref:alpha/beta hydrolase n=1 Tax=Prevotella sp. 10(H) TaxID=1158294 RepID=UPI0004A7288D|nr:alpha/beta fold hydrolase [Prevotella sp. 10(H)]